MKYILRLIFVLYCAVVYSADRVDDTVRAVAKVLPSVVNISTERVVTNPYSPWGEHDPFDAFFREFFGEQMARRTTSLGSGVVIDPAGLILTNFHVVNRATEINVLTHDGKNYKAVLIASDHVNDLALIALMPPPSAPLKPIEVAHPDELYLGEAVIAVGNPYGLGSSVSKGILSATNREASYRGRVIFSDILQTDTAINPGNSGGPLINILGQMIGINTAIHREAQNIGFAIPVRRIELVLAKWLIPERFSDVSLGIIPEQTTQGGFQIAEVLPESPAEKAGLKAGMRIISMNGKKIENLIYLGRELWKVKEGDIITLEDDTGKKWKIKASKVKFADGKTVAKIRLDLELAELDGAVAQSLDYPFKGGLIVSKPPKDNPGIRRGSILVRLNDTAINNFDDVSRALKHVRMGQQVKAIFVELLRQGGRLYIIQQEAILDVK